MSHQNLRVMFQDEAGFGRINKPKRCWCAKGHRPFVPCYYIREYRYLYGTVMSSADPVCMNIFLQKLSEAYLDDYILY